MGMCQNGIGRNCMYLAFWFAGLLRDLSSVWSAVLVANNKFEHGLVLLFLGLEVDIKVPALF